MFSLETLLVFPQEGAGGPRRAVTEDGTAWIHRSRVPRSAGVGEDDRMKEQAAGAAGMADQRREQMLRAALEVITERGYPDTRVTDVAERAGTSPALVIYYFKTRDQLLTEALRYSEDAWHAAGTRRLAAITTAAGRLTELIAMTCLPDTDPAARSEWLLWLDLWALSPRNQGVAAVRRKFDERWRQTIATT